MKKILSLLFSILIIKSTSIAGPEVIYGLEEIKPSPLVVIMPLIEWAIYALLFITLILIVSRHVINKRKNKTIEDENEKQEKDKLIKQKLKIRLIIWGVVLVIYCITEVIFNMVWTAAKPIIYIYPEEIQEITVELGSPEKLTCTYPKYKDAWKVVANPSGKLIDVITGREYYALYWEGEIKDKLNMSEGFVVKKEDTINFLEEKLKILGLNEREANEFIVYWLPRLEKNKYNFIRFQTLEDIEKNMLLNISPKPDNIIRVMMQFKGINRPIIVEEQELKTPSRDGFTVVEWGGIQY